MSAWNKSSFLLKASSWSTTLTTVFSLHCSWSSRGGRCVLHPLIRSRADGTALCASWSSEKGLIWLCPKHLSVLHLSDNFVQNTHRPIRHPINLRGYFFQPNDHSWCFPTIVEVPSVITKWIFSNYSPWKVNGSSSLENMMPPVVDPSRGINASSSSLNSFPSK